MSIEGDRLIEALTCALQDGGVFPPSISELAESAARAHGYLVRVGNGGRIPDGRLCSPDTLRDVGVTGLMESGTLFDAAAVARELAEFLAGPSVPSWDYAVLGADLTLAGPIPVVNNWELITPSVEELTKLVGIPTAAAFATRRPFDPKLYAGLPMLRRPNLDREARSGLVFLRELQPEHALWQPLLALALYQNTMLRLWARYDIEPGRRGDVRFDHVPYDIFDLNDGEVAEIPGRGSFRISAEELPRFQRYLATLRPLLEVITQQKDATRLRRVAEHFLTAGENSYGEGDSVVSERNADSVLHYVIALEATLAGVDIGHSDLTRKVSQRAAVLAGRDNQDRIAVEHTVRKAYAARSAYAHGSQPANVELSPLRRVVRNCIFARLALGDKCTKEGSTLAELADKALLDHQILHVQIREQLDTFWATVDG